MSWVTDDLAYIAQSLGLKRSGSEYKGPCPNPECGGSDRFHISRGRTHPVLMYCRHGCTFSTLAKVMHDRGLMAVDEYDREQYVKQKREEAMRDKRFQLSVYENAEKSGHKMSYKEKMEYRRLKNYINVVDNNPDSFTI